MDSTILLPENDSYKKANRQRSSSYPSYTIDSSVALATRIDKEFTSAVYTPASFIKKHRDFSRLFGTASPR